MLARREVRRLSASPLMNGLDDKPTVSLSASPQFSTLMRRRSLSASGSFADLPQPGHTRSSSEGLSRCVRLRGESPRYGKVGPFGNLGHRQQGRKSILRGSSDESESKNSNSGYGSGGDWGRRGGGGDDQAPPFDDDGDFVREIGRTTSGNSGDSRDMSSAMPCFAHGARTSSVLGTASRAERKGGRPLEPNGK